MRKERKVLMGREDIRRKEGRECIQNRKTHTTTPGRDEEWKGRKGE